MEIKKFGLALYFIATFLATFAVATGSDTLRLFTNPVVIPAITFYYINDNQEKYCHAYGLILLLCFIGDILVFLDLDVVLYIMIPYFISYLLLFHLLINDIKNICFNKKSLLYLLSIFISLATLIYILLNLLTTKHPKLVLPTGIYGSFLILYACLGIYNYLNTKSANAKYLLFFIILSIFSDVFYVIFKLITSLDSLVFIEFCAQLLSYYFVVKYFSNRKASVHDYSI